MKTRSFVMLFALAFLALSMAHGQEYETQADRPPVTVEFVDVYDQSCTPENQIEIWSDNWFYIGNTYFDQRTDLSSTTMPTSEDGRFVVRLSAPKLAKNPALNLFRGSELEQDRLWPNYVGMYCLGCRTTCSIVDRGSREKVVIDIDRGALEREKCPFISREHIGSVQK